VLLGRDEQALAALRERLVGDAPSADGPAAELTADEAAELPVVVAAADPRTAVELAALIHAHAVVVLSTCGDDADAVAAELVQRVVPGCIVAVAACAHHDPRTCHPVPGARVPIAGLTPASCTGACGRLPDQAQARDGRPRTRDWAVRRPGTLCFPADGSVTELARTLRLRAASASVGYA
jgi:hypothetical protein